MKTITFPAKSFTQFIVSSFKSFWFVRKLLKDGVSEVTIEHEWPYSEIKVTYKENNALDM